MTGRLKTVYETLTERIQRLVRARRIDAEMAKAADAFAEHTVEEWEL